MKVKIDSREQSRIPKAEQYFQEQGYETVVEQLPTGDYIIGDQVVFEYKTEQDFISSISDKRVFNEALDQSEEFPFHFVVIQGTPSERKSALFKAQKFHDFNMKRYYSAIAMLNTYTTVIHTQGRIQTAFRQMEAQAQKCLENRVITKEFRTVKGSAAFNFLNLCVQSVGPKTAKKLCDELKLRTLSDLLEIKPKDIESIEGMGKKKARKIIRQIRGKA